MSKTIKTAMAVGTAALLGACNHGSGVGFGGTLGTTGVGAEVKYTPDSRLMLRGSYQVLNFESTLDIDDIEYDGDVDADTFGGFVDLAPFGNGFIVSGGAYVGDKVVDLVATPSSNVEIGGMDFTPEQVGTLDARAEFDNVAPYLGIGYDGYLNPRREWSFNARAGVLFAGSADVSLLSVNGEFSDNPLFVQELRREVEQIEEDIEDYKYYPVVTVGVTRRF